jgi:hypothetical protein
MVCVHQGMISGLKLACCFEIGLSTAGKLPLQTIATIHYGGPWPLHVQSSGSYSLGGASLADTFHVWGIVWTTTQVRGCAVRAEPASAT